MLTGDGGFVLSPSDLTRAADCEFGWLRGVDVKLGRITAIELAENAMLNRTAELGNEHEERVLVDLIEEHGNGVVQLERPQPYTTTTLAEHHDRTIAQLKDGVDVLFQGVLFDGGFGGMADFIARTADGTYQVQDAKLARRAKVTALLQIAAYADLLDGEGVPRSRLGALLLGDRKVHEQNLDEIIPVYRHRRARLEGLLAANLAQDEATAWNDPGLSFCGTCDWCAHEVEARDDLLLVAGLRKVQRAKLRDAGMETIQQLATATGPVPGISNNTLANLRAQAGLQVAPLELVDGREVPATALIDGGRAISALPAPSPGDVFFDFEGDPLWSAEDGSEWGLEYLWGVIEPDSDQGDFLAWWAHDRAEEKTALIEFLDYVVARRAVHPGLHVYHYAPYEITALKRLVGRHATHEDVLDDLLRANVFVDLYQVVKRGIRTGTRSYSIKKLEPLYMGDDLRTGVDNAADSIVEYQRYCEQKLVDPTAAVVTLDGIADYNRYDCVSTWRLRDWLRSKVAPTSGESDQEADPEELVPAEERIDELAPVVESLLGGIADIPRDRRTDDQQALAMLAASLGYHQRENKSFWWSFFERLVADVDEWPEPRDCFGVDEAELVDDWHVPPKARTLKRSLRLVGRLDPATRLGPGGDLKLIYDEFPPGVLPPDPRGRCVGGSTAIVEVDELGDGRQVVTVLESVIKDIAPWDELPMGLCVGNPVSGHIIAATLLELARSVAAGLPVLPDSPGLDLVRRVPPRLTGGGLAVISDSAEQAILDSVRRLDRSYLAIQGPPGTGKTYVGSRVVAQLVRDGWKVGVVAQSHAVVCHFLSATVKAGLDPALIAKPKNASDGDRPWNDRRSGKLRVFVDDAADGCLVGGTAWTFVNRHTIGAEQLDLLVVDEAGQFSLANTLGAATAAQRVLLLGDPQQLPQVSQGTHPEPVDESALSWVAAGHATMPTTHGYFLERSWRMHSDLTAVVSDLSYEGRLRSEVAATDTRELAGMAPGVHRAPVIHADDDVQSIDEARAIVELIRSLPGTTWKPEADEAPRPTTPTDVLVVAPYNAQVALIRRELDAAGLSDTRVGTVDKFQGQEAPVVIVSMTASSPNDVPRGMDFLLNRNRLNVAISRGQWAAHVVHSPALADSLPATPEGLAELGAFLRVVG